MTGYVYRIFGEGGMPLYIGATKSPSERLANHYATAPFAERDVTDVVITEHPTMRAARIHEDEEIKRLRPRWNIYGRGHRSGWQLSDYVEVILAIHARRERAENPLASDRTIARYKREIRKNFPDVGGVVLADLEPHTAALTESQRERWLEWRFGDQSELKDVWRQGHVPSPEVAA